MNGSRLNGGEYALAPVISLDFGVKVIPGSGDGSYDEPWDLTQIDVVAPEATLASNNVKETSFTLTATGSDNIGVTKYEFYINGSLANTIESTEGSVSWDVTGKTTGETYTCKVRVYDAAGNWKDSDEISVTPSAGVKLASVVEVGDFVDYDAGIWTQEDLNKITNSTGNPTVNNSSSLPTTQGQFGGFTTGQSRNTNSTPYDSDYTPDYSGWRVWSVDGDTVTLISAGHPESFYIDEGDSEESEIILQNRNCSMYVNNYASSASMLSLSDFDVWYKKYVDSNGSATDLSDYRNIPYADLIDNGSYYWFATAGNSLDMRRFYPNGVVGYLSDDAHGVRVLITLKSDVMTPEDGEYGTQGNPWKIKGQDPTPTPWTGGVATGFASGTGTETDPYMIETAEQLAYLASTTNAGNTYSGKYIALGADIDLGGVQNADGTWSGAQWTPIGIYDTINGVMFEGNFKGNGYDISNLYINKSSSDGVGLFAWARETIIKDVNISSGYICGNEYVGSIVGFSNNLLQITDSINNATIEGVDYIAGLIGRGENVALENCINYGKISGNTQVGGIIGEGYNGRLSDCINNGTITGRGDYSIGGIVGHSSNGTISRCNNKGNVTGKMFVGGIVGMSEYDVIGDCINDGNITGDSMVAGIAGAGDMSPTNCINNGTITGNEMVNDIVNQ